MKLVPEISFVCAHLKHTKKICVTNQSLPELQLHIHLNQCAGVLFKTLRQTSKIYLE